jgi:hypothetical protein
MLALAVEAGVGTRALSHTLAGLAGKMLEAGRQGREGFGVGER